MSDPDQGREQSARTRLGSMPSSSRQSPFSTAVASRRVNPETVGWLVAHTKDLLKDERARGESLRARGAALVGSAGITLSIISLLASGGQSRLESAAVIAAVAGLAAAAALSLVAVLIVVVYVLSPSKVRVLGEKEINRYDSSAPFNELTDEVGRALRGLKESVISERERNDRLETRLRWGYALFSVSLTFLSTAALTLIIAGRT